MADDVIVTNEHVRMAGMCSRGARQWFAYMGLDYADFLRNGLPASRVEATNDALGLKVVAIARAEAAGED